MINWALSCNCTSKTKNFNEAAQIYSRTHFFSSCPILYLETQALLLKDYNNKDYGFKCNLQLFPFPHLYSVLHVRSRERWTAWRSSQQVHILLILQNYWKEIVFKLWFSNHSPIKNTVTSPSLRRKPNPYQLIIAQCFTTNHPSYRMR